MARAATQVSIINLVVLIGFFTADIGLLAYTWLNVRSKCGSEAGKTIFFVLPTLLSGGLFVLRGMHSLSRTLPPKEPESNEVTDENLGVSPSYTTMMLVYGCSLLFVTVAALLFVINLNLSFITSHVR